MKDLYEAIGIFLKYSNEDYPSWCKHDELHICVEPNLISEDDIKRLEELSFIISEDEFVSFKFGSC